jgi:translation initiation factor IF-2
MSDDKAIILFKAAKELNIGIATAVEFLGKKGFAVENKPTTKLSKDMYDTLLREFQGDKIVKEEANQIVIGKIRRDEPEVAERVAEVPRKKQDFENEGILIKNLHSYTPPATEKPKKEKPVETKVEEPVKAPAKEVEAAAEEGSLPGVKIVGKIDLNDLNSKTRPAKKEEAPVEVKAPEAIKETPTVVETPKVEAPVVEKPAEVKEEKAPVVEAKVEEKPKAPQPVAPVAETPASPDDEVIKARSVKLSGPNIIGKIVLPTTPDRRNQPVASSGDSEAAKRKRKRKKHLVGLMLLNKDKVRVNKIKVNNKVQTNLVLQEHLLRMLVTDLILEIIQIIQLVVVQTLEMLDQVLRHQEVLKKSQQKKKYKIRLKQHLLV